MARVLQVTLGDLLGEPVLLEDEQEHDDVPAIRDALMASRRLSRTLFSMSMPLEYIDPVPVARLAEAAWSSYQKGDLGQAVTALPGLIKTTQQMEVASTDDATYRRSCAAVSARVHHLAATTLRMWSCIAFLLRLTLAIIHFRHQTQVVVLITGMGAASGS